MTPGFDTALILRTSAASGWKKALVTGMGVNTDCMAWGAVVGLGVGLLLKPRSCFQHHASEEKYQSSYRGMFMRGLLGNLFNPKVGVFCVSFLPQFIPAGAAVVLWSMGMAFTHVVIGTVWNGMLIASTQYFAEKLRKPAVVKVMDRLTGCVFIGFAAKLASSHR